MPTGGKDKPKTKAGKVTRKKKTNLNRLYTTMNKLTIDAVDNEVMKRFKLLIDSLDDDMPKNKVDSLIAKPSSSEPNLFPEGLQPYIKHFIFMNKRNNK